MRFIAQYTQNRINEVQNRDRLLGASDILLGVLSAAVQKQKGQTIARLKKQQSSLSRKVHHTVSLDDLNGKPPGSGRNKFGIHEQRGHRRIPSGLMKDMTDDFITDEAVKMNLDEEIHLGLSSDDSKSEDSKKDSEEEEETSLSFITHFGDNQKKHRRQPSLPITAFPLLTSDQFSD